MSYTGKLCHRGKYHSGNCHSGERWMSRPFVHSGNLNFKHTFSNNLVFHNAWKHHLSLYNIKKDMLLTGPFAMLSMPSFDFHLPPCTEGFLIHLSPLWQLPLWQLPLFPSGDNFPVHLYICHQNITFVKGLNKKMCLSSYYPNGGGVMHLYFILDIISLKKKCKLG